MTRTSLKAHAACKCTHTGIDAVLSQVEKHGFTVSDVESAHFALGSLNWHTVAVPEADKWAPETVPQCQFSLPYALSVVMHEGGIFLDAYTNEARKRADVRGFMKRITASSMKVCRRWARASRHGSRTARNLSRRAQWRKVIRTIR